MDLEMVANLESSSPVVISYGALVVLPDLLES